ncbi:hypothetical protein OSB04_007205 [Centaurea solstitialis]|uniref:Uncharacterized protein n=1 Tax=Centaurea solstitialis TaxID=347529 RepID=A0AA38TW46_9ASTR|nr:hypothetical protein OSB04_007205 [Centaurea solstitialis]
MANQDATGFDDDSMDPGRKYGIPDPENMYKFTCKFCGKETTEGVYRVKQHIVRGFRNSKPCLKCPEHVRIEVRDYMIQKKCGKHTNMFPTTEVVVDEYDDAGDGAGQGGRKGGKQQTINEVCRKDLRDKACKEIARWFYDAGLPFNAASYDSFHVAIEAVLQFGPGFKPPSMHELRVLLLKNEVESTQNGLKDYKTQWALKGAMLEATRPHLYWTPCAAHCIDLMLEDIGKIPKVKNTLKRAMFMNGYIYNHVGIVNMMRRDKKPTMGYIYESIDRAKETIVASFLHKEEQYKKAFQYIDARWDCQLHRPLHAAEYFLNPEMYYENPENAMCVEVMNGLYACIQRLVPDLRTQDKMGEQLDLYQNSQADWWFAYGALAPELQKFAIRVLSLTCSATGCERNWSFNRALRRRYQRKDTTDPIFLNEIDESNELLMGHMDNEDGGEEDDFVFNGDDLTWSVVDKASGASQATYSTRRTSTPSSSRDKGKGVAQTSTRTRPSSGLNLIDEDDEEMEQDIGLFEDDGEEEVLGIDVDDEEDEDEF